MITVEKEKQLKESMKIMGLPSWLHWTAWFTQIMLLLVLSITVAVLLLKFKLPEGGASVFPHTNAFALWLFLFVCAISVTMFTFLISVIFSNATIAATVAFFLWVFSFAPYGSSV